MKIARTSMLIAALGAAAAFAIPADADSILYEGFDYQTNNTTNDNVAGNNGGVGFSGAWSNTRSSPNVYSPSLTWGPSQGDGSTGYARGQAWSSMVRPIGSTLSDAGLLADGSTLWFSAIMGLQGQNTTNADLNLALTNSSGFASSEGFGNRENLNLDGASSEGIGIGQFRAQAMGTYWQNNDGAADNVSELSRTGTGVFFGGSSGGVPRNPYTMIVGKIDWGTGGAGETLTLYAPAENALPTDIGAPVLTWSIPDLNQATFDTLAIQFKDQSQIDEIRFGATVGAVHVPSPSAALIGALGLGGIAFRRRRG